MTVEYHTLEDLPIAYEDWWVEVRAETDSHTGWVDWEYTILRDPWGADVVSAPRILDTYVEDALGIW